MTTRQNLCESITRLAAIIDDCGAIIDWRDLAMMLAYSEQHELEQLRNDLRSYVDEYLEIGTECLEGRDIIFHVRTN